MDAGKIFSEDSTFYNSRTVTPDELALINKLDAEAPASVKPSMDAIAVNVRLLAAGNYAAMDSSGLSQGASDVLAWLGQNCTGVLSPSP